MMEWETKAMIIFNAMIFLYKKWKNSYMWKLRGRLKRGSIELKGKGKQFEEYTCEIKGKIYIWYTSENERKFLMSLVIQYKIG